MISNCGHDEHGRYSGGQAGDQTGKEWEIIPWYNRPWNVVLRHPNALVRAELAYLARAAAKNNHIGYDQGQRLTYWDALTLARYDPTWIAKDCEADCSSGVVANVKAVGYRMGIQSLKSINIFAYTGNLRKELRQAGFLELTDRKYLESDAYLTPGDILLHEGHHVATNLDPGSEAAKDDWYIGTEETEPEYKISTSNEMLLVVGDRVNVRSIPGGEVIGTVTTGQRLNADRKTFRTASDGSRQSWYRVSAGGWMAAEYLQGWVQEADGRWWYLRKGYKYPRASVEQIDGKWYAFDVDGWLITPERMLRDGEILG